MAVGLGPTSMPLEASDSSHAKPLKPWGLHLAPVYNSRLIQFLGIGAALFALAPPLNDPFKVDVPEARVAAAVARERARRGGEPLEDEARAEVLSRAIEDELLVREARRLGLDSGDTIVRNRLIQKILFLAEDQGGASRSLSEQDLRDFYNRHPERYRALERIDFVHVFARESATLAALRNQVLAYPASDAPPPLGEAFPQPRRVSQAVRDLERSWGAEFKQLVAQLPEGLWSEPIPSSHGHHLVKVVRRSGDTLASFDSVRDRLALDALIARREAAVAQYVDRLFDRYDVRVAGEPFVDHRSLGRTAIHTAPSVED